MAHLVRGGAFGAAPLRRAPGAVRLWGDQFAFEEWAEEGGQDDSDSDDEQIPQKSGWLRQAMAEYGRRRGIIVAATPRPRAGSSREPGPSRAPTGGPRRYGRRALTACGEPDPATSDSDAAPTQKARFKNKKEAAWRAKEGSLALLEASVISAGLYLADAGDDHAAAVGAGRDTAFWLRAQLMLARALRVRSCKKALRKRGERVAKVHAKALDICAEKTERDAKRWKIRSSASTALLEAIRRLADLRRAVAASVEAPPVDATTADARADRAAYSSVLLRPLRRQRR